MRVDGVVVVEPAWQLADHGSGVGLFGDANVVPLHGAHERFGHAVGLRAFDGCCAAPEVDLAGEAASLLGGVAAAVICQPFDGGRQAVHAAEAVLDGGGHEIAHVLGGYASSGGNKAHRLAIAAVEREGTRTFSPLSQPISNPSEHQRVLRVSTATRPSWRRSSALPLWRWSSRPCTFITR